MGTTRVSTDHPPDDRRTTPDPVTASRVEAETVCAGPVQRVQSADEQERATLAAVMASMTDGLLVVDSARGIRYCNVRAGELLGVDPSAVIGQSIHVVINKVVLSLADPEEGWASWEQMVTNPQEYSNWALTMPGPPRRDILVSAFAVPDPAAASLGLLVHDVRSSKTLALLEERARIAMDLHDGVIQSLYGVVLGLGGHVQRLDEHAGETRAAFQQAIGQINDAIKEIRSYIFDLQHQEIEGPDLHTGLAVMAGELQLHALLRVRLELDPAAEDLLSRDDVTSLLQIAHEATSNIKRHARASAVTIRLTRVGQQLALTITDNGQGFPSDRLRRRSGHGLRNMARRATALGGRLVVVSEPGHGTEVRLELRRREVRTSA